MCLLENMPPFYFPSYLKSSCLPSNQNDPGKTKDNRVMSCYALHEAFLLSVIVRNIYRMSVQFTLLRRNLKWSDEVDDEGMNGGEVKMCELDAKRKNQ